MWYFKCSIYSGEYIVKVFLKYNTGEHKVTGIFVRVTYKIPVKVKCSWSNVHGHAQKCSWGLWAPCTFIVCLRVFCLRTRMQSLEIAGNRWKSLKEKCLRWTRLMSRGECGSWAAKFVWSEILYICVCGQCHFPHAICVWTHPPLVLAHTKSPPLRSIVVQF